jgi:hypothetical protein
MTHTQVRFEGVSEAVVDVPGRLLPLIPPPGIEVRRSAGARDEVVLRRSDPFSAFVGRFSIPYVTENGSIDVTFLNVPPAEPWRWSDIQSMWSDLLSSGQAPSASRAGGHSEVGIARVRHDRDALDWLPLNACNAISRRLLARWPQVSGSKVALAPLESARGNELVERTEEWLGTRISLLTVEHGEQRVVPEMTARRVADSGPWKSQALALVSGLVVRSARARGADPTRAGELPTHLLRPLEAVSQLARSSRGEVDLPISSWPPSFVLLYRYCIEALVMLQSHEPGNDWVPLADLWRIYEAWVALRVFNILESRYGVADIADGDGHRISASWQVGSCLLRMFHPHTFGGTPDDTFGVELRSVTSELEPDIVLSTSVGDVVRLAILDPKNRLSIDRGTLAVEASKYLWGIRNDANELPVRCVVLVAPRGGAASIDPHLSGMSVAWAMPEQPAGPHQAEFGTSLSEALSRLLTEALELPNPTTAPH